jgi:uncharacterized protein
MRFAWVAHWVFLIAPELLAAFILVLAPSHASAQFFFDNRFSNGPTRSGRAVQQQPQWFWPSQQWQPWQSSQQSVPRHIPHRVPRVKEVNEEDFSKAPPARKRDSPTTRVEVMGDAMAGWLAYGLEEALSETPEIGVIRKVRSVSGLLPSASRDAYDWPLAAREILAADTPDFVVMMIGLGDRQAIGDRQIRNAEQQQAVQQSLPAQPSQTPSSAVVGVEQTKTPRDASTTTNYDFRSDKWSRFYAKRIDDSIAALKSRGVPVLWVGLPAIRGKKSTADIAYLDDLYRSHAEKAGIIYIDVWDGFVDEDGDFALNGPDFEGQIRRLRTSDGVYFTKAGALKLGYYVERELRRMMLARPAPAELPAPEPPQTQTASIPSRASPLAGPVVALTAKESTPDELLGDKPSKPPFTDSITTRVLVRGEPIVGPAGRADDFVWPRRESLLGPATSEETPDPGSPMLPPHALPALKRSAAAEPAVPKGRRKHAPKHAMPRSLERPPWQFGGTGRFSAFWPIGPSQ